ncbi:MAG TPA: hypothetical protein VFX42_10215, partial [Gemmatimonadales bacterium]|nr:hypothetical protein [Gemmatimonadales bacterium]
MHRPVLLLFAGLCLTTGLCLPACLSAQTNRPSSRAAGTITGSDVARRIGIIADDSMMGRDTPSRGLELTAQYVASQFKSFGLLPGGDSSSWLQRYQISRRRLDLTRSRVVLHAGAAKAVASFTAGARHLLGEVPEQPVAGTAWLVSGPMRAASVESLAVKDRVLVVPFDISDLQQPGIQEALGVLYSKKPKAILLLTDRDSAGFVAKIPPHPSERTVIGSRSGPVALELRSSPVTGVLQAAGVDLADAHSAGASSLREVPGLQVRIEMRDSVSSSIAV